MTGPVGEEGDFGEKTTLRASGTPEFRGDVSPAVSDDAGIESEGGWEALGRTSCNLGGFGRKRAAICLKEAQDQTGKREPE